MTPHNSPENFAENRLRISREFKSAGVPAKLINDCVDIAVAECLELRDRIANRIIGQLIDRGGGLTEEQLEKLAYIVEYHFCDAEGSVEVVEPPQLPKLRVI